MYRKLKLYYNHRDPSRQLSFCERNNGSNMPFVKGQEWGHTLKMNTEQWMRVLDENLDK